MQLLTSAWHQCVAGELSLGADFYAEIGNQYCLDPFLQFF